MLFVSRCTGRLSKLIVFVAYVNDVDSKSQVAPLIEYSINSSKDAINKSYVALLIEHSINSSKDTIKKIVCPISKPFPSLDIHGYFLVWSTIPVSGYSGTGPNNHIAIKESYVPAMSYISSCSFAFNNS